MKRTLEVLGGLLIGAMMLAIIFVQGSKNGKQTGGQQAADIIGTASSGLANVSSAIETGSVAKA